MSSESGSDVEAEAAYDRAIAHYERGIELNQASRATADHYIALAMAGRARLALEGGDHARALAQVVASFARKPDAAASRDGLNISPVDTAKMLLARLNELEQPELAAQLQTALDDLDPAMLELPAYERQGQGGRGQRGQGRRGQRSQGRGGNRGRRPPGKGKGK